MTLFEKARELGIPLSTALPGTAVGCPSCYPELRAKDITTGCGDATGACLMCWGREYKGGKHDLI